MQKFIYISILWICTHSLSAEKLNWEKVKYEKGVTVYRAEVNKKTAFRGVGIIQGNPKDLVSVIENPDGWKNWIENFKSGKLIEKVNHNHKIFYQVLNSPFPLSNRDVLFESVINQINKNTIRIEMKSVRHPKSPPVHGVRIKIIFTRYLIEKISNNSMRVTFETLSDPGGSIPDFVINWASENYPVTLFEGLRKELNSS